MDIQIADMDKTQMDYCRYGLDTNFSYGLDTNGLNANGLEKIEY
jgi:hypothetical protein